MNLSHEQLKTFEGKGFVVVKDFFDKDVMQEVSALVDGLGIKTLPKVRTRNITSKARFQAKTFWSGSKMSWAIIMRR